MQNAHRPMGMARFAAVVGDDGLPAAWFSRTYGSDSRITDHHYAIANLYADRHGLESHITTTAHRAPGSGVNGFMLESFVDEVAQAGGWDPLEWRIELTKHEDDTQLVLNTLKANAGFTTDLPRGEGMGVAIIESHGTICAMCATVTVSCRGQLRVEKMVTAVDSGHVVNPDQVTAQQEGCIAFELSHAWVGGQNWQAGQLVNNNFDKYNLIRIEAMPEIEMHLALSGGEKWGGMGEPGVPPVGAAVANAVFYASGKRMYSTPFVNHDLSWS